MLSLTVIYLVGKTFLKGQNENRDEVFLDFYFITFFFKNNKIQWLIRFIVRLYLLFIVFLNNLTVSFILKCLSPLTVLREIQKSSYIHTLNVLYYYILLNIINVLKSLQKCVKKGMEFPKTLLISIIIILDIVLHWTEIVFVFRCPINWRKRSIVAKIRILIGGKRIKFTKMFICFLLLFLWDCYSSLSVDTSKSIHNVMYEKNVPSHWKNV